MEIAGGRHGLFLVFPHLESTLWWGGRWGGVPTLWSRDKCSLIRLTFLELVTWALRDAQPQEDFKSET